MKYKETFIDNTVNLYKQSIELIRAFKLSKNNKHVTHQNIVSYATYSPWYDDEEFLQIYNVCKAHTLIDIYRLYELWSFIKKNNKLEGDIVEVGVWKGGSGVILAKSSELYSSGKVYLADTFTGVVKASNKDTLYKGGEHSDTSLEIVKKLIQSLKIENVEILKGIFPEEVNLKAIDDLKIKLCHIDVDTYDSAKDIVKYIWPYIVKGGVVIFDDYGFWGCEGITKLINELELKNSVFMYNLNGHGVFIKI